MADGRHIAEYWKRYNSPINGPIWMKLGCSHPIMSPICPPCCGCHGNGRFLATVHCTFSSYGRLEAECVNQYWWNLVHNSKLGPQWQSRDQILKFLKFKIAGSNTSSHHCTRMCFCNRNIVMYFILFPKIMPHKVHVNSQQRKHGDTEASFRNQCCYRRVKYGSK